MPDLLVFTHIFFKLQIGRLKVPHIDKNSVVNLSSYTPSSEQLEILNLGKSFVCSPSAYTSDTLDSSLKRLITNPTLRQVITQDILFHLKSCTNSTLFLKCKAVIKELLSIPDIIISIADKGGNFVILDLKDYDFECLRQLSDTRFYRELDPSRIPNVPQLYNTVLQEMLALKVISRAKMFSLLPHTNTQSYQRYFYILPKIHKAKEKWTIPFTTPPGRPITTHALPLILLPLLYCIWAMPAFTNSNTKELLKLY